MLKRHLCLSIVLLLAPLALMAHAPQTGLASYYGGKFHGRKTASGEIFSKDSFTAAHRTLPFGTMVRVTNPENNKFVVVRINDRGPMKHSRMIDLSYAAAKSIGMLKQGILRVRLEELPIEAPEKTEPLIADKTTNPVDKTDVVNTPNKVEIGYSVQVGAFQVKENASKMKLDLLSKGYKPVTIVEDSISDKAVFKVMVGPYATMPETLKIEQEIKSEQNLDAFVTPKRNN